MEYIITDSKNKTLLDQSASIEDLANQIQSLSDSLETLQTDLNNFITIITTLGQTTYKIYGAYSG